MPAPHCGRLDLHPPHVWPGFVLPDLNPMARPLPALFTCPGLLTVEGGARVATTKGSLS